MPGQLTNSAGVRIQKRDDPRQRPERRCFLVRMLAVKEQLNEDGLKAEKAFVHIRARRFINHAFGAVSCLGVSLKIENIHS